MVAINTDGGRLRDPVEESPFNNHHAVRDLMEFIRFPSISVQPAHAPDVRRCAEWLASHLRQVGLEHVSLIPTPRHPIVYADWVHAPGKPFLLIYGHYDVQPVDPIEAVAQPAPSRQVATRCREIVEISRQVWRRDRVVLSALLFGVATYAKPT